MGMRFTDREQAGRLLAAALPQFRGRPDTVVLGLACGGVPVAAEAAASLRLPWDVLPVRKLGVPGACCPPHAGAVSAIKRGVSLYSYQEEFFLRTMTLERGESRRPHLLSFATWPKSQLRHGRPCFL